MKLYEYAIIYTPSPTKEQHERGDKAKPKLIGDITRIFAASEREATILAARSIPEQYTNELERVEIALRPF